MNDQRAFDIVSTLANGANPATGEIFAPDSPYQLPEVIRALFVAQRALEARLQTSQRPSAGSRASQPRAGSSANAGKPWSTEEDRQLLAAFDANQPIADIARTHGRNVGGVRARLEKHGRLDPSSATRWPAERTNEARGNQERDTQQGERRSESARPAPSRAG